MAGALKQPHPLIDGTAIAASSGYLVVVMAMRICSIWQTVIDPTRYTNDGSISVIDINIAMSR